MEYVSKRSQIAKHDCFRGGDKGKKIKTVAFGGRCVLYFLAITLWMPQAEVVRADTGASNKTIIEVGVPSINPKVLISFEGRWSLDNERTLIESESDSQIAHFIDDVIRNNRTGNVEKILALWKANERDRLRSKMANEEAMERNTKLFENIGRSWLYGVVHYGEYRIGVVVHSLKGTQPFVKEYPMALTDNGRLQLTNDLSETYLFSELIPSLSRHYLRNFWLKGH